LRIKVDDHHKGSASIVGECLEESLQRLDAARGGAYTDGDWLWTCRLSFGASIAD
jgi:hypothetical protein